MADKSEPFLDQALKTIAGLQTAVAHIKGAEPAPAIVFWYRNYRGEEGYRRVRPLSIRYGSSEWHKEEQWLMLGYDTENNKQREFAMKDMSGVIGRPTIAIDPGWCELPSDSPQSVR